MPLALTWADVGLRIVLTILAAAAIGYDRDVEGHAAGLRTVILVALAASLAMVQANWLMDTVGKSSSSFAVLDLMRLPLGILTGVGFIGGGAGGSTISTPRQHCPRFAWRTCKSPSLRSRRTCSPECRSSNARCDISLYAMSTGFHWDSRTR